MKNKKPAFILGRIEGLIIVREQCNRAQYGMPQMIDQIIEIYDDVKFLKADGFDDAIIGVASDFTEPRLVYSVTKCLQILEDEGMDPVDAIEHFTFNVSGGYVGEQTPIWCWDNFFE